MEYQHTPVMLKEAIEYLRPQAGDVIVDCTLGGGGYTMALAKKVGSRGKVIGIDADEMAIKNSEFRIQNSGLKNIILSHANFKDLQKILEKNGVENVNGVVFDLGLSSYQLHDRSRGFSFNMDQEIDMAFGGSRATASCPRGRQILELRGVKTEDIVNKWKQDELEKIIREYGEERYAGRIAGAIIKNRPVQSAKKLGEIISKSVPRSYERGRINPATRTFQALRIATNDELNVLQEALPQAVDILSQGGRLVVVSYHSLEDRIVKNFFKQEARGCVCPPEIPKCQCKHKPRVKIITKKVARPSEDEARNNPRARSAKLRCAEKIG